MSDRAAAPLHHIVPGLYGRRDPLTFYIAPREIARLEGITEDAATLEQIERDGRRQLAEEFPDVPVELLPDDAVVWVDLTPPSGRSL